MTELSRYVEQDHREEEPRPAPKVVIIRGIPGAGKTEVALSLMSMLPEGSAYIVDPDFLDTTSEEYQSFFETQTLDDPSVNVNVIPYRYLLHLASKCVSSNQVAIWSQPFSDSYNLSYTIEHLRESVGDNQLVVDVITPPELAWERVLGRMSGGGHGPDEERFRLYVERFVISANMDISSMQVDGRREPSEVAQGIKARLYSQK